MKQPRCDVRIEFSSWSIHRIEEEGALAKLSRSYHGWETATARARPCVSDSAEVPCSFAVLGRDESWM